MRHLVPTRLNALGDAEKELLRHVATCRFCRHFTAGSSLHRQLVVECRCASTQGLLDLTNRPAAYQELQRAAAILTPDLDYARALYCQTLARLRREQGRHEEALALASRAVSLFEVLGDAELGEASNELGWTLLLVGEPSEALEIFLQARDLTRSIPATSVSTCLGLALALIDIKNPRAVDSLLADADVAIDQVSEPVTRLRLRWQAAQVAHRHGPPLAGHPTSAESAERVVAHFRRPQRGPGIPRSGELLQRGSMAQDAGAP